jgi:8-oxo-dGTP diphosphatase
MHLAADGRPLVAACYIVQDGRLLMVRRRLRDGAPEWTGPSGNVEPGETPEQAAVREVQEEVGLTVEVMRRLGERVHPATGRHLIYLVCRVVAGEPTVVDREEVTAVEWCDRSTVIKRWAGLKGGIYPAVREYLEQTLSANKPDRSGTALPPA